MSTRDDTESMNDVLAGSGSNESVNAGMETFVRLLYINQTLSPGKSTGSGPSALILALFVLKERRIVGLKQRL